MQLISFIAFVMTDFSFVYQILLRVYMLEKVKTIFYFSWSIIKNGYERFFGKNGLILGKFTKGD